MADLLLLVRTNTMGNPDYGGLFIFIFNTKKIYKSYHDEKLYSLRLDQSTHIGQISDRTVQNFRQKSSRKKIK